MAHYGLPAAGIISLLLLREGAISILPTHELFPMAAPVRDLTVLVAHIEVGAITQCEEPNFGLFSKVARTIRRVLQTSPIDVETESANSITLPTSHVNTAQNGRIGQIWTFGDLRSTSGASWGSTRRY